MYVQSGEDVDENAWLELARDDCGPCAGPLLSSFTSRSLAFLECKSIANHRHRPSPNLHPNPEVVVANTSRQLLLA